MFTVTLLVALLVMILTLAALWPPLWAPLAWRRITVRFRHAVRRRAYRGIDLPPPRPLKDLLLPSRAGRRSG